ncbi:hypothetical protein [Paenibacillus durus]|uniref:Phage protein n=1 Tax=Paenibacillus durus TaxID=44251 RepID=A0A089HRB7_PAEDU|nr:hypothetical protein [Paenibacillus durus]AIQ13637.1 hypothetical protein PDUR_18230 [Paenibacillus durus]
MPKFRKKPVVIDAWQFTKENFREGVPRDFRDRRVTLWSQYGGEVIEGEIDTLEGKMRISEGDYLVKGVSGEFYPCKPDIFALTYEEVDE